MSLGPASPTQLVEEPTRATVDELQARIRKMQATRLDTRLIPTHPAIAGLLPGGVTNLLADRLEALTITQRVASRDFR